MSIADIRWRTPGSTPRKVVAYLAVGASGVAVDLGMVALTVGAVGLLGAQVLAWAVAATWNWGLNSTVTWDGEQSVREWATYLGVDSGRLLLRLAVVAVLAGTVPDLVASAVGIGTAALAGFIGFEKLVFTT